MSYRTYAIVRVVLVAVLMAGIFGVQPAKAETVGFGWVQGGGGANLDYGTAIALDDSGNVYDTRFVTNGTGNEDGFLNKWDSNGNPLWSKSVAGTAHDADHGVAVDGEGNVYVSGAFSDTVEFDPGNTAGNLTSAGLTDIFVIKYDGDGNFIWVKGVGGNSSDGGYGITVDATGNVYVTGIYVDTVDFDPGSGVSTLTSAGFGDVFVLKLDSDGNFLWAKGMGGSLGENSFDIAVDESGNVFTTGYFNDTADFDPGAGTSNLTSLGQGDIFLSKLDSSGNFVWAIREGGGSFDASVEITLDGSGNAYMTGYVSDVVPGGYNDILISKLDPDGNFLWTKYMGGIGFDAGYGIALDEAGNIYTTGEFGGTADFDPGAGTSSLTSAGASDVFISKLDNNGNFVWARNLGGTSADLGDGIVVKNDSLYLAGAFSDTVDFDLGAGTNNLTSAGNLDVFISKLNLLPQVYYVKWNATGTKDGSSWTNAYTDLQSALAAASSGDEIWVAAGTYKPTSTIDRTISFALKNGVAVYGGFAGNETARAQRDYETNLTTLSGDIGMPGDKSDNSYHVVVGSNTDNSAILDGFTVTRGNANSDSWPSDQSGGGGMYNKTGSPSVRNVTFFDNFATFGGGMYNLGDYPFAPIGSHPVLSNVIFENNSAVAGGGGMRNEFYSSPALTDVILKNNSVTRTGGGMENFDHSSPTLTEVTFEGNTAGAGGGGMFNWIDNNPILTNVVFHNNSAEFGGGMGNHQSNPVLTNVVFSDNSATSYGGGMSNEENSNPTLTNVTFHGNTAASDTVVTAAGGMYNLGSSPSLNNVTFSNNSANEIGGGMVNELGSSPFLINVTFSNNSADSGGAMLNRDVNSNPFLAYVTLSNNTAAIDGGAIANAGHLTIRNSILWGNAGGEIFNTGSGTVAVANSIVQGGYTGQGNLDEDPLLGPLQNNGGFTQTMALGTGSPAIDSADTLNCPPTDQRGVTRPQRSHCDRGAYEYEGLDSTTKVIIGNSEVGSYVLSPNQSLRKSFPVNSGPVQIVNTDSFSIMAAERVIHKFNGVNVSFSEMMGLPNSQVDNVYWLPWYNSKDLDTQLRIANVSGADANVQITIGGMNMGSFILPAGKSTRKSFPNIDKGPVKIGSDQDIIVAERVIYTVNGAQTSFSELMAMPEGQLDTTYWLPWYNSKDLDTQLRIANVSNTDATVQVSIGGTPVTGSPFTILAGKSIRRTFPGIDKGLVKIESNAGDARIVAAERVIYKVNNVPTSFSEMMALPDSQVDTTYWMPWYNSKDLNTQLRIANVSNAEATVHVRIRGVEVTGSPFTIPVGGSKRLTFPNIDKGPVQIESNVDIIAAERVIYSVNTVPTSFSEIMGMPESLLDSLYWFPWYNSKDLDTQLRFGMP